MLEDSARDAKSLFKNPLVYSTGIVLAALLAVAFILYSRWETARALDRAAAAQRAAQQREQDRQAVEQLGGSEFSILDFYASPRAIRHGEFAKLCYGVSNAKRVTLEPQPSAVWPSAARCVDVSPTKTTTYTLTIFDAAGNSKAETVELVVR